ncbi:D-alanine--D-alanine ligase A [Lachnospiraceae bacterium]|nr:D-alanine--D-alanine ligase A [Lachnospiraceae bacterium]
MGKQTIAVIFGGQSSEHEISCMSAANIIEQIDRERYELLLVGITKDGHWIKVDRPEEVRDGSWREKKTGAWLSPDATQKCLMIHEQAAFTKVEIDLVFPILHGLYGEDGTIQGLCELAGIPYVGCGVAASAVAMDKGLTKLVVQSLGIDQASFLLVTEIDLVDMVAVMNRVEDRFSYPVFVKPCNAGSSCGVTKVRDRDELAEAFREAARYDRRILVEEAITGHEVECAVLGGGRMPVQASGVGEILAAADFYDYEAKYFNTESRTMTDPPLPGDAAERVRDAAIRIFRAIDGYGLARADFFVTDSGRVVFNEINTMPGFTAISMYPVLWEARGKDKRTLIQELITLAFERAH